MIKDNVDCDKEEFEDAIRNSLKSTFDVNSVEYDEFVHTAQEVTKRCVAEGKKIDVLRKASKCNLKLRRKFQMDYEVPFPLRLKRPKN